VTLEDVIEELIGEEIIDESDVFVDVHRAIRRMAPAPRTRVPKGAIVLDPTARKPSEVPNEAEPETEHPATNGYRKLSLPESGAPKVPKFLVHRRSSGGHSGGLDRAHTLALRGDDPEIKQHLKHLGPSNAANRPKTTRINTVKIKPGLPNTIPEHSQLPSDGTRPQTPSHAPQGGIGEGLLDSAGLEASDGVHSVAVGYGTMTSDRMSWKSGRSASKPADDDLATSPKANVGADMDKKIIIDHRRPSQDDSMPKAKRTTSVSTVGSLRSHHSDPPSPVKKRHTARSGSISENVINVDGVKKIVLETTSSSDSESKPVAQTDGAQDRAQQSETESQSTEVGNQAGGKKKRKKRPKKKKAGGSSESQPLLGGERS
jgi:metal transporter CNNM